MDDIVLWAAAIGVIGTAAGAVIGIIGNIVNNQAQAKLHSEQLEHDAGQRKREREMSLRRDVYFPAAEAVIRSQTMIASLANIDIPDGQVTLGYQNDVAVIGKIQLVGTTETVRTVAAFLTTFTSYFLEISLKRISAVQLKNRITQEMAETAAKRRDEAFAQSIKDIGRTMPAMTDYYRNQWQQFMKENQELSTQADALRRLVMAAQLELTRLCFERSLSLGMLLIPAVVAVRAEMELPFDKDEYLRISQEAQAKNSALMEGFLKNIEQMIVEAERESAQ